MDWTSIVLGGLTLLGGCAWFVNFRKDKQEAGGIRADNRQKEMDLSKMYVDELTSSSSFAPRPFERARWRSVWRRFKLNIVVPLTIVDLCHDSGKPKRAWSLRSLLHRFRATLKWIFWILIGLIGLIVTAKVCLLRR